MDGDKVVGFVCYFGKGKDAPGVGEINAIYVLSDYYGTGVSKKLMDVGLEHLKDYHTKELWVLKDNPRAISFYKKYGFKEDGTQKEIKSLGATEIRMVK